MAMVILLDLAWGVRVSPCSCALVEVSTGVILENKAIIKLSNSVFKPVHITDYPIFFSLFNRLIPADNGENKPSWKLSGHALFRVHVAVLGDVAQADCVFAVDTAADLDQASKDAGEISVALDIFADAGVLEEGVLD